MRPKGRRNPTPTGTASGGPDRARETPGREDGHGVNHLSRARSLTST
ncbi:hypothetical protein B005_0538 [Nocardiopsis alba ATCC BAA-2165]|uniref:Uncharacterized protein n=1 Tax=Nocardiopsis alba (strain ATCC BAA-2165 / BE74) TaxID=1205910 RepID=J7LHW5_NOCAA|nr:hypothetical protein B005_0538 [Nocardiopsis alba ATCC BAA-2165]